MKSLILVSSIFVALFSSCQLKSDEQNYWNGLIGAYYGDPDLTNIKFPEVLHSLNNSWDEESGHGSAWSGQYEGFIISPVTGELKIFIETNKTINYQIDNNKGHVDSTSSPITLILTSEELLKHHILFSFLYTEGDPGSFRFSWSWDGQEQTDIPDENIVFSGEQSLKWNWLPEPDPNNIDFSNFIVPADLKITKVFYETGKFAGWPANGGIWGWDDEIVVNYTVGHYKELLNHHSIDESKPKIIPLSRTTDGGKNWSYEGEFNIKVEDSDLLPAVDFSDPNLAIRVFSNSFMVSYDRCKSWLGLYPIPDFGYDKITSRTDYIPLSKDECIFFFSHEDKTVQARLEDKAFSAITRDGGKTFEKLGDICRDDNYRAVMPSTVKVDEDHFISALRRRFDERFGDEKPQLSHNWIDLFESKDGGITWKFLSKAAETDMGKHNGNPPSLIKLQDGRLCLTYGYRAQPYGIRAKISEDNGNTWSDEIHLRNGAREFDLGYTRSTQRKDGKILTVYYFNDSLLKEQFIECTIWDPNSIKY